MEKMIFYLLIVPEVAADGIYRLKHIYMLDETGNVVLDHDEINSYVVNTISECYETDDTFITYDGELLSKMLECFFGIRDYDNIISLSDIFATEYGCFNELEWMCERQPLETALRYYYDKGCISHDEYFHLSTDPNDYKETLYNVFILYMAMKKLDDMRRDVTLSGRGVFNG